MWSSLIPVSKSSSWTFLEQFGLTVSTNTGALMVLVCTCSCTCPRSMKDLQYLTHQGLNHGQVNKSNIEDFKQVDENNNLLEIFNGCFFGIFDIKSRTHLIWFSFWSPNVNQHIIYQCEGGSG